jgi:glycosyltransferase involved in cell wall biosynthesis
MKSEDSLVSIGLPTFKILYLEKALTSLLNQSYKNIEIIIVNDASPEDIDSVVSKFYGDKRISYYKNNVNLGATSLVSNWNKCLDFAKGEFFVLASDDDLYHENFVAEMVSLSKKYPQTDLFHARVAQIDKDGKIFNLTPLCPEFENCFDFVWHRVNGYRLQYAPDFMCRTKALRLIKGFVDFPSAWVSDDATWFLLAKQGGVAYSSKILFYFRYSGINFTSGGHIDDKIKANYLFKDWLHSFLQGISDQEISTEVIYNQFLLSIEKSNSQLLSSWPYWKLLANLLLKRNSVERKTLIQAIGRKMFS